MQSASFPTSRYRFIRRAPGSSPASLQARERECLAIDNGDGWDFNNPDVECGEIGEIEGLM